MSQLPTEPERLADLNSPATDEPIPALSPRRVEDLDPPYSAYPAVEIKHLPGDGHFDYALGVRHIVPYATFVFEKWAVWSLHDFYGIYFNGSTIATVGDTVMLDQPRYPLSIPEEHMPDGEVQIRGLVERVGSGQQSTSPWQTILIKRSVPGGRDINPGDRWHPGLVMSVLGFAEGAVLNPGNVGSGVTVKIERYENIRRNDYISVSWDGIYVYHWVTEDEAQGVTDIHIFVSSAVILQGNLNGRVMVRFTVSDVAENPAGDKFRFSKPYFLSSELDPSLREAPAFLLDGDEVTQLDWDFDSEKSFEALCFTGRITPAPNPRNYVVVTLTAFLDDDIPQTVILPPVTDNNQQSVYVTIPNDVVEPWVGGSFHLSYEWFKADGSLLGKSGSNMVDIVGTLVSMPAPDYQPIDLGLVDPDQTGLVHIPDDYAPYDSGWLETLVLEHIPSGGGGSVIYTDPQLAGAPGGTRVVTPADLAPFNGKGDTLVYYTTNDGFIGVHGGVGTQAIRRSRSLTIQVGPRIANMPIPELQGRIGENVNPAHVVGDPLLTLPYTGTRDGDRIHWSIVGSALGGSDGGMITINPGTAGQALRFTVDRKVLDLNNNGSLSIRYSLEREGPPREVLRSEVLNLTVGIGVQLDRPIIRNASLSPDELNPLAVLAGEDVIVKFRPMQATDRVFVDWISADGIGSTTGDVPGNPTTNEVSVRISPRTIAQGIREAGNTIDVQYRFSRGMFDFESDVVALRLLPLTGLPTATIDGISGSVLDLSQLSDTARTRVSMWSFIHANQRIWMRYTGTKDGSPWVEDTYTANLVTADGVTNGIRPPTPVDKLKLLDDGSTLTIEVWVSLAESTDKNTSIKFGVAHFIIQALPSVLPHPFLRNASGVGPDVTVDPLAIENSTIVTVRYTGMSGLDDIFLKWIYADGTDHEARLKGQTGGEVSFDLTSAKVLHKSVGTIATLRYSILRNGVGTPIPSEVQTVRVSAIASDNLPAPLLNGVAPGGALNLNSIAGNLLASLAKWRLSAQNQRVWLTCRSSGVTDLRVLDGYAITSSEAVNGLVNKPALRSWFTALADNAQITVSGKIAFDGVNDESKALPCPVTTYTVRAETPTELPYPRFANLAGQTVTIDPRSYDNNTGFVRVAFTPMDSTMWIELRWQYPDGTEASIERRQGNTSGVVNFTVSTQIMANSGGKQIKLSYIATINGVNVPSQTQSLNVSTISVAIRPLINNVANGGQLDVANLPANALVTIARWPLQYAGMQIWLRFRCTGASPNPVAYWEGLPHYYSNGVEYAAPLAWLNTCPDGGTVTVEFKVGYVPNVTEAQAVSFPVTTYSVYRPAIDDYTPFTGFNMNGWVLGSGNLQGGIVGDADNYVYRFIARSGTHNTLQKVYSLKAAGAFSVSFRYRVATLPSNGIRIYVAVGSVAQGAPVTEANVWKTAEFTFGRYIPEPLTVQVGYGVSNASGTALNIDDIRVRQIL